MSTVTVDDYLSTPRGVLFLVRIHYQWVEYVRFAFLMYATVYTALHMDIADKLIPFAGAMLSIGVILGWVFECLLRGAETKLREVRQQQPQYAVTPPPRVLGRVHYVFRTVEVLRTIYILFYLKMLIVLDQTPQPSDMFKRCPFIFLLLGTSSSFMCYMMIDEMLADLRDQM
jgi:hypothetical protein